MANLLKYNRRALIHMKQINFHRRLGHELRVRDEERCAQSCCCSLVTSASQWDVLCTQRFSLPTGAKAPTLCWWRARAHAGKCGVWVEAPAICEGARRDYIIVCSGVRTAADFTPTSPANYQFSSERGRRARACRVHITSPRCNLPAQHHPLQLRQPPPPMCIVFYYGRNVMQLFNKRMWNSNIGLNPKNAVFAGLYIL